ncbi:MAG: sugar phosphate isomerase/epimerase [Acidobacteria bacterium]|nr:sugar phosphate isomerase/epimerase [Acidobacteriota bacterium]
MPRPRRGTVFDQYRYSCLNGQHIIGGMLFTRRRLFAAPAAALAQSPGPTRFQLACMTLPYSQYPFERALKGIKSAGYDFVAWGTTHPDSAGKRVPLLDWRAPVSQARDLARISRDHGLEPVMMFTMVNLEAPEAPDAHARRITQAAEARIPFVLTFGKTERGLYENAIRTLKHAGPLARQAKLTVVIKQHGGNTATGSDCSRIIADVADEGVKMCYDAGNVLDYENNDPIPDIQKCWRDVRAFAIKDHRNWPTDTDCGPGFGEIDHYKLLSPVLNTGLAMPLAFENIFEPMVPRPTTAEGVDALARRSREYVDSVIRGLRKGA